MVLSFIMFRYTCLWDLEKLSLDLDPQDCLCWMNWADVVLVCDKKKSFFNCFQADEVEVVIDPKDIELTTARAGGAGG